MIYLNIKKWKLFEVTNIVPLTGGKSRVLVFVSAVHLSYSRFCWAPVDHTCLLGRQRSGGSQFEANVG
jgi:hypothetical protein